MAIIKSLAVGKAKGSAMNLTYTVLGGETIMKGKVAFPQNPKTLGQMSRRVRWANIVSLWHAFNDRDKPSFEDKEPRVSDFNAFIGANIGGIPVYLTKQEADQGGCVVAAYQLTRGSLPALGITTGTGGVPISSIELGNLVIDGDTSLKEFSDAVINNNPGQFLNGDQITFFHFLQEQNPVTSIPYVRITSSKVTLNQRDEDTLLQDVVSAYGFTTVDGKLGASGAVNGGCAWIHSRIAPDSSVLVSSQTIYVSNALLTQYQTTAARTSAIQSYGGKLTADYLRPDVDAAIEGF